MQIDKRFGFLLVIPILVFTIYLQGISGAFYYDDFRPLGALSQVNDFDSALVYVLSETSGPLGRPIAMLSFLFNLGDWPNNSEDFFLINIAIHVFNGIIIYFIVFLIAQLINNSKNSAIGNYSVHTFSLLVSTLWLLLPIHVSTSLIAIQRMAGLSALFVFLGLAFYLYGLHKQQQQPNITHKAAIIQFIAVTLFTTLASLTKENGILLPALILMIELTLLKHVKGITQYQRIRLLFGALALTLVIAIIFVTVLKHGNYPIGRSFTTIERALTQPQILLEYLRLAFIPDISAYNPFHDNYRAVSIDNIEAISIFSWAVLIICLGLALVWRKKRAVFSFAVLWFLTAHILESTFIPLELYFQHRNYVALLGPCFALIYALSHIPNQYVKVTNIALGAYLLILAISLLLTTSLWGQPMHAAEAWFYKQKNSQRAAINLSSMMFNQNQQTNAIVPLVELSENCKNCSTIHLQAAFISCLNSDKNLTSTFLSRAEKSIVLESHFKGITKILQRIGIAVLRNDCKWIDKRQLQSINTLLLDHKDSTEKTKFGAINNLYVLNKNENSYEKTISLLLQAWNIKKDTNLAKEIVRVYLNKELKGKARKFVNDKVCIKHEGDYRLNFARNLQCDQLTALLNSEMKSIEK